MRLLLLLRVGLVVAGEVIRDGYYEIYVAPGSEHSALPRPDDYFAARLVTEIHLLAEADVAPGGTW